MLSRRAAQGGGYGGPEPTGDYTSPRRASSGTPIARVATRSEAARGGPPRCALVAPAAPAGAPYGTGGPGGGGGGAVVGPGGDGGSAVGFVG